MGKHSKRDKNSSDDNKPSKQEKAVATYVRHNCPTKKTMVHGDEVHYFTGCKAIDCLMESKWSPAKCKKDPLFHNRASAVTYMQGLMDKGMVWRARKLVPKVLPKAKDAEDTKKSGKKGKVDADNVDTPPRKARKTKESAATTSEKVDEKIDQLAEEEEEQREPKEDKKKKKRKVKLDFHRDQIFRDGSDVFVWHFDPITWTKYLIGVGMVLGSVLLCLFPLWPDWVRLGVYYMSLGAMGLLGLLFFLVVMRFVVFSIVWGVTMGKHHLWILPNLTEDCGVLESFHPAYSHEYKGAGWGAGSKKKSDAAHKKDDDAVEGEEEVDENEEVEVVQETAQEEIEGDDDSENNSAEEKSEDVDDEDIPSSAPPSPPQGKARQRRARRDDDDSGEQTNGFEVVN